MVTIQDLDFNPKVAKSVKELLLGHMQRVEVQILAAVECVAQYETQLYVVFNERREEYLVVEVNHVGKKHRTISSNPENARQL